MDKARQEKQTLAFQGDRHFTYDQRGNLTKEARGKNGKLITSFTYNAQNQLVEVDNNGTKTQYQYDALGRRTKKVSTKQETEFLWDGDVLLSETQRLKITDKQEPATAKIYVFEPHSFKPLAQIQNRDIYHYHLDHLGTPQELTANDGSIVWSARYKTYGNLALKEIDEVENNLRFQGQYFDQETGLHYNRHRYYNPNTGQFTQQDPIGLLGGLNNYQYAPNPIDWTDPLGMVCKERFERYKALRAEGMSASDAAKLSKAKRVDDPDLAVVPNKALNPLDDPKVAKQIQEDPSAIYGYSPKPGKGLDKFGIDFSSEKQVASAREKRIEYLQDLAKKKAALEKEVSVLQKEGVSLEDVARMKVDQRNQGRIDSYLQSNNLSGLKSMQERNLIEYGRKEGPTADQLFEKKGSWEGVIFGSVKSSRAMDALLGLD